MTRRQTIPEQWFIADERMSDEVWATLQRVPRGSGVLVLGMPRSQDWRLLRRLAAQRGLVVIVEGRGVAARVHNVRELRRALLQRTPLILLSPMFETRSHPDWKPLPRMRAAALARLAGRRAVALGGMNAKRYARVAPLGFIGWAGIGAWSRP